MSPTWLKRVVVALFLLPFSYLVAPKTWWFLPRLLFGHNRAIYGTYTGPLLAEDGGDLHAASARVQVQLTVRPSAEIDTGNTYGYRFRNFVSDYLTEPDVLAGTVDITEGDGTVDHYQLGGRERDGSTPNLVLRIRDGDRTEEQIAADVSDGQMRFTNLSTLRDGPQRAYGGVLSKSGH